MIEHPEKVKWEKEEDNWRLIDLSAMPQVKTVCKAGTPFLQHYWAMLSWCRDGQWLFCKSDFLFIRSQQCVSNISSWPILFVTGRYYSLLFAMSVGQYSILSDDWFISPQHVERSTNRWALGCLNPFPAARGSQEARITQPRARFLVEIWRFWKI